MTRYVQDYHLVPVQIPVASAGSTAIVAVNAVNMSYYNWCDFVIQVGSIDETDAPVVTVLNSSAATTVSAVAIPFAYRLSSSVGADAMGALTTCSSAGYTFSTAMIDMTLVISIDPRRLDEGYPWVRLYYSTAAADEMTQSVLAILTPKYAQDSMISST
jgi:hypothetical protein